MKRTEWQGFIRKVETGLEQVGKKARELAREIEKDARYGTQMGKLKLNQISLEGRREKILKEIGERL